ncbi:unnamed protein product (mitochondrion) [Plasmodiophora brassicae]|uniref:Transmembrane protein n=1 Tax=Plasmodiophora brassicae TaxID=37360 RepID=A0A0G4IRL0_PLABS|nr:hypothetical protein PBRA_005845 [Plasmodiophora brassicae]SPQ98275.1 unnamed protein product [Plasmodiophora brassicae]
MANDAMKKRGKRYASTSALYLQITIGVQLVYLLFRVMFFWSTFSAWWSWALLAASQAICYQLILAGIASGRKYSYYQDILFISWFVQVTLCVTEYAWITALLIPGYILFKAGSYVFSSLKATEGPTEEIELSEREKKKLAKLERHNKQREARYGKLQ